MISQTNLKGFGALALLLAITPTACRKEEQVVSSAAQSAVAAEQKAQAVATQIETQRASLAKIPLPTKSLYVDVHEPNAWVNPFLSVNTASINLRVMMADGNPSGAAEGDRKSVV